MILITEFMAEDEVARIAARHLTDYSPDLADRQAEIPSRMAGIKALIVRNRTQVTEDLLNAAPCLKVVGRLGVGLDNIDLKACADRGIEVIPAVGANTLSVAEYVVVNAANLLRNAYHVNALMMAGEWPRALCSGRELAGRRLGLVGFGGIARETGRLARALGMTVAAYDPHLPEGGPEWADTLCVDLDELLGTADVVSLHVPLTDGTRHMINAESLAQMPKGAVLINAARGGVVDEQALATAMRAGHVAGAALDVFETEPLTREAAKVFEGLSNIILTPHIAGVTSDSNARVSSMIAGLVLDRLAADQS